MKLFQLFLAALVLCGFDPACEDLTAQNSQVVFRWYVYDRADLLPSSDETTIIVNPSNQPVYVGSSSKVTDANGLAVCEEFHTCNSTYMSMDTTNAYAISPTGVLVFIALSPNK